MNFLYCTKQKIALKFQKLELITDFSSIGGSLDIGNIDESTPQLKLERFQNLIITHVKGDILSE